MPTTKVLQYGDKGERVTALQRLLRGGKYGNFKPGPIDGEFGPRTAASVQRAKRMLGYKSASIKPVAGAPLLGYLVGTKRLTPAMVVRRKVRLERQEKRRNQDSAMSKMRRQAAAIIRGELGTTEAGGTGNHIKYNEWWGWGAVPYCVIGISWAWTKAGSKAFIRGSRWAGTDLMLADAKAGDKGIVLDPDPQLGSPGVIDFDGHSDPDHAITFVQDNGDGTCQTMEFNTTGKDGMEGVWNKTRPMRQCWWFEVLR